MAIPLFIGYAGNIIWLLIPFRQLRTEYFFFFLIYSVTSVFFLFNLHIHPAHFYLGQGVFLIISLYNFKKIPFYKFVLFCLLIILIILTYVISIKTITLCLIIENSLIFFIILKRIVLYSFQYEKLNLFNFVLLLFMISVIMRFVVVAGNIKTGIIFFYLTAAFSILIGIFFLFYNEKNSPKFSMASKDIIDN